MMLIQEYIITNTSVRCPIFATQELDLFRKDHNRCLSSGFHYRITHYSHSYRCIYVWAKYDTVFWKFLCVVRCGMRESPFPLPMDASRHFSFRSTPACFPRTIRAITKYAESYPISTTFLLWSSTNYRQHTIYISYFHYKIHLKLFGLPHTFLFFFFFVPDIILSNFSKIFFAHRCTYTHLRTTAYTYISSDT